MLNSYTVLYSYHPPRVNNTQVSMPEHKSITLVAANTMEAIVNAQKLFFSSPKYTGLQCLVYSAFLAE
jgi:hypothetical protein